jgi:(1->4)-alpha-D-glucan 1-alpha-D-glucosylmutase
MSENPVRDALLQRTLAILEARQRRPEATYRLQFHAGFRFRDAEAIVPYLHDLGITDAYASPYLRARPGSQHGYDISDHNALNPEIGTAEEYENWVRALQQHGLGQVLDVVPNHMGIVGNQNVWWNDVLENGRASPYAGFFDIDWRSIKPDLHDKVLLPILGDPYGKALEALQLRLTYENGSFNIHYFDHQFPVSPCSYNKILGYHVEELKQQLGREAPAFSEYASIRTAIGHVPSRQETDPEKIAERNREKEVIKRRLATLAANTPAIRAFLDETVKAFNSHTDDPHSFDRLDDLLEAQAYRLAWWRVAADEINYRRFFDINELAAISMEKESVFTATHQLILRLLREGKVTGLRIDHPDGLYDPQQYLERLQEHYILAVARSVYDSDPAFPKHDWTELEPSLREAIHHQRISAAGLQIESRDEGRGTRGEQSPLLPSPRAPRPAPLLMKPLYVVVEKILGRNEQLPESWPVDGTTGYEFLHAVNNLFVERDNAAAFDRIYFKWSELDLPYKDIVYRNKFLVMQVSLASELNLLAVQLDRLSEKQRWSRDFTLNSLRRAVREIIAHFEVYRTYITGREVLPRDRVYVDRAVLQAKRRNPAISAALFDFVRDMLLLEYHEFATPADQAEQVRFVGKFQQLSAPVMAKSLEDTTFYVYNRLLSLNEVGGDPREFGSTVETFHQRNEERRQRFPHGLSATATHDTKRGEDTRVRIDVLSEVPRLWQSAVQRWAKMNGKHKEQVDEEEVPGTNVEYFLYQTLVGAWPLTAGGAPPSPLDEAQRKTFLERIQNYVQKAIHEAKVHTSWINPNPAYDRAMQQFVERILDPRKSNRFLRDFQKFQQHITHYALFASLAQTLLKVAAPGTPDVYQGTELWDFSLVDPDNRRPVDYALRQRLLAELRAQAAAAGDRLPALARELVETRRDGRIKMYVLMRALHGRRANPGLFSGGAYLPASASAEQNKHVCALVRRHENRRALVVVPRLLTRLLGPEEVPLGAGVWKDGVLFVPGASAGSRWRNVFTGEVLTAVAQNGQVALPLAEIFATFPVALFLAE